MRKLSLLVILLTLCMAASVSAQDFSGQTVVVVTQTGSAIGGPVLDKGPIWEEMTGGNIELQTFAFGELFEKISTALATGSGDYDVIIYAADWAGDIMAPGYVLEISEEILEQIDVDDVIPLYADRITTWGGVPYALPYDGDAHMLYYRKDLFANEDYQAGFEAENGSWKPIQRPLSLLVAGLSR